MSRIGKDDQEKKGKESEEEKLRNRAEGGEAAGVERINKNKKVL